MLLVQAVFGVKTLRSGKGLSAVLTMLVTGVLFRQMNSCVIKKNNVVV